MDNIIGMIGLGNAGAALARSLSGKFPLQTAQDFGVSLFATLAAHTPYETAERLGYGDLDYAALAKLWESWCDLELAEHG